MAESRRRPLTKGSARGQGGKGFAIAALWIGSGVLAVWGAVWADDAYSAGRLARPSAGCPLAVAQTGERHARCASNASSR